MKKLAATLLVAIVTTLVLLCTAAAQQNFNAADMNNIVTNSAPRLKDNWEKLAEESGGGVC